MTITVMCTMRGTLSTPVSDVYEDYCYVPEKPRDAREQGKQHPWSIWASLLCKLDPRWRY